MKKTKYILTLVLILIFGYIFYTSQSLEHTFILSSQSGTNKSDLEISPIFSTIKVSSEEDTDVVFTDVKTKKTFTIGYITPGIVEKIKLEKGHWYKVESKGNITVSPVNVRTQ